MSNSGSLKLQERSEHVVAKVTKAANDTINPHSLAVMLQAIPFGRVIDSVANEQLGDAEFAVLCGRVLSALQAK